VRPLPTRRPPKSPRPTGREYDRRARLIGERFVRALTPAEAKELRRIEAKERRYTAWLMWPDLRRLEALAKETARRARDTKRLLAQVERLLAESKPGAP